ncbi:MAG: hypothetical protein UR60_C0047G0011 [Candidatus Moranbacteria bacterium GW2011_GWF2_34_56]|nr:MAG: hypothetical protein UR51_C0009G0007 [Candidatus Moranbacteria bacterium GW2011_GWF1_34_10]KKP63271.1 MAG: hypothetical protein UR60_C0047G0011 [Candidatus Moranbacteria bacterium GW2011_GWF2_34_56]HBI17559.1 hypothetical protein [Candidatus Moranbacteria bacterium]
MRKAYIASGPRGSGKTTFIKKLQSQNKSLIVFERDEFLNRNFGERWTDPYYFPWFLIAHVIEEEIKNISNSNSGDINLIVDCWNGNFDERNKLVKILRDLEFDVVNCIYFCVPREICLRWFRNKSDSVFYSDDSVIGDWNTYHRLADDLRNPDEHATFDLDTCESTCLFDNIFTVNPAQMVIPGMRFNLQ